MFRVQGLGFRTILTDTHTHTQALTRARTTTPLMVTGFRVNLRSVGA